MFAHPCVWLIVLWARAFYIYAWLDCDCASPWNVNNFSAFDTHVSLFTLTKLFVRIISFTCTTWSMAMVANNKKSFVWSNFVCSRNLSAIFSQSRQILTVLHTQAAATNIVATEWKKTFQMIHLKWSNLKTACY